MHGTNLCAVEKIDDHTLNLRFMHGQTYGFQAYHEGDMVAFIKASTMERLAKASVISVKKYPNVYGRCVSTKKFLHG